MIEGMPDLGDINPWLLILTTAVILIVFWRIRRRIKRPNEKRQFTTEYFKGLNYLLNDEQGKALDIFVKLVESNWDIIDTHFALGKIFRKNGEIDKAIKIHQGLIARPSLPDRYRSKVLLELGFDYLGAGWFDRAEGLFKEVLIQDKNSVVARRNLILIYQQEKDWHKAIDVAVDLFAEDPKGVGPMISQYYCELADLAQAKGDVSQIENNANQALRYDASSVRANILLGDEALKRKDHRQAIRHFEQIELQDPEFMPVVLDRIIESYELQGETDRLIDYLTDLVQRQPNIDLIDPYISILERYRGKEAVISYLREKVIEQPSTKGMKDLLELHLGDNDPEPVLKDIVESLRSMQTVVSDYHCRNCGFDANTLFWMCPSCHHWSSVKPPIVEDSPS